MQINFFVNNVCLIVCKSIINTKHVLYNILRVVFSVRKLVQQHHKRKSFQRGKSRLEYFGRGTELKKMASLHGGLGSQKKSLQYREAL